jgi:hypothetical protein
MLSTVWNSGEDATAQIRWVNAQWISDWLERIDQHHYSEHMIHDIIFINDV